jgi:hypothetical protein
MTANKYILKASGVEVDYTIGATPSLPSLIYKAGAFHKSFTPNEILVEDTGLGKMVSVTLITSIEMVVNALVSFCRSSTWLITIRRISTRWPFMRPLVAQIPSHIGLRHGVAKMTGTAQSVIVPL